MQNSETLSRRASVGRLVIIYFLRISFSFICLLSWKPLPHFSLVCLRNISLASHPLSLSPAFHYFLTVPLMFISLSSC